MKILLVYTNRNRYITPPPVGLAYLIKPLQDQDHDVQLLDLMFSKQPFRDLEGALVAFGPEMVGFSIRNLDNQYMLNLKNPLPEIKEMVAIVRNKGILTVLGGTAFTTFPEEMLRYMEADFGIAGQGEESLPLLVAALERKENSTGIPGLVCRHGQTVSQNPAVIKGYAGQIPDWSLIDMEQYKRKAFLTPPAAIVVKTGCPYQCSYCDARISMGNQFIGRETESVIEDICRMKQEQKVRSFFLVDPCFNSPLDDAKQLLQQMIKANLGIRFLARIEPVHGCLDAEFFELFRRAGGYSAQVAFTSFSETMLERYQKPFTMADIYLFNSLVAKNNLRFGAELLFGGPGETSQTIKEAMGFLSKCDYAFISYAVGIRINPHTAVFDTAKNEGLVKEASELLFSKFYVSRDIDVAWARKYIDASAKKYAYRYRKMLPIMLRNTYEALLC